MSMTAHVRRWWRDADRTDVIARRRRLAGMQAAGMSQRAIATEAGISQQQICRLLKKHRKWLDQFGEEDPPPEAMEARS